MIMIIKSVIMTHKLQHTYNIVKFEVFRLVKIQDSGCRWREQGLLKCNPEDLYMNHFVTCLFKWLLPISERGYGWLWIWHHVIIRCTSTTSTIMFILTEYCVGCSLNHWHTTTRLSTHQRWQFIQSKWLTNGSSKLGAPRSTLRAGIEEIKWHKSGIKME